MAKGKGGKSKGFVSQGKNRNVSASTLAAIRRARREDGTHMLNLQSAWLKGKNPWITVDNPGDPCRLKVRKRANEVWGNPKDRTGFIMKSMMFGDKE